MKNQDDTGVTFVNTVLGRGILNGVINISFSTFNFSPDGQDGIEADPVVSARLRMDVPCLKQLHQVCSDLIAAIEAAQKPKEITAMEEEAPVKPRREKAH
jgi:hypothetical protein